MTIKLCDNLIVIFYWCKAILMQLLLEFAYENIYQIVGVQ
jgi:hypothetical protein